MALWRQGKGEDKQLGPFSKDSLRLLKLKGAEIKSRQKGGWSKGSHGSQQRRPPLGPGRQEPFLPHLLSCDGLRQEAYFLIRPLI